MKDNFTHVCFIIDQSGSMYTSVEDVKGGFKRIIDEQKANTVGTCAISMYTFDGIVNKLFTLKDISEIDSNLDYSPGGSTALNDAVGTAIEEIGEILASMEEKDRPASNLIVIMTDGCENASHKYTLTQVRDMIKHQTDKYNWAFMYLGADITTSDIADSLGIKYRGFSSKQNLDSNYAMLNDVISSVRFAKAEDANELLNAKTIKLTADMNAAYAVETGISLKNVSE